MLKILIADDERLIRNGLKNLLDAEEGFCVTCAASNGLEALEAIQAEQPDLVITDIRMPKMDGRELVKTLYHSYPKIRKVIISGYEDFGYVHEAMRHGAIDYLLKPIDEKELIALLRKIEAAVISEEKQMYDGMDLQSKLNQSLPLLREDFVRKLMQGNSMTEAAIRDRMASLGMNIPAGQYCAIIVKLSRPYVSSAYDNAAATRLNTAAALGLIELSIPRYAQGLACMDGEQIVCIIAVPAEQTDAGGAVDALALDIDRILKNLTGDGYIICMGSIVADLTQLKDSCMNARLALKQGFYNEEAGIVRYSEAARPLGREVDKQVFSNRVEKFYSSFINSVELLKTDNAKALLDGMKQFLKENRIEINETLKLFNDLFTLLQSQNTEFKRALGELHSADYLYFRAIEQMEALGDIVRYSGELYGEIIEKIRIHRCRKDKKRVEVVKEYIGRNYHENISLTKISEMIYVNPHYFCEMFKAQTGENFVDYLTRVRMEKAKVLLRDMKIKTYEVGALVGYEDSGYFCKVFKKVVGITPGEYKNINI